MTSPFAHPELGVGRGLGRNENAACEAGQRVKPAWSSINAGPLPIDLVPFALTWDYIVPSIALVDGSTFCPV
jgi:hypothetical protein